MRPRSGLECHRYSSDFEALAFAWLEVPGLWCALHFHLPFVWTQLADTAVRVTGLLLHHLISDGCQRAFNICGHCLVELYRVSNINKAVKEFGRVVALALRHGGKPSCPE